jgi:hypothetical protein
VSPYEELFPWRSLLVSFERLGDLYEDRYERTEMGLASAFEVQYGRGLVYGGALFEGGLLSNNLRLQSSDDLMALAEPL